MLVNVDGVYVDDVAPIIAAVYPSEDDLQLYVITLSPPLEFVKLPITLGVPP